MGRFDALTTLDIEPLKPPAPPEKPESQNRPVLSPLLDKHEPGKPANMQTGLHANPQTRKDASMQTSKPAKMQASKPASLQTGKHAIIEKYSTYLTPACKKGLKRIAFETDRKDYDVLIEAVEQYLERNKQPQ
jgi:hypothetical protein